MRELPGHPPRCGCHDCKWERERQAPESFWINSVNLLDRCTYTAYGYYMNTNTKTITAEIVLTGIEGSTWIFVNGEHIGTEAAGTTMVTRVDKALRAAHVYRQTGFVSEAGALIAEGTKVVAA